MGSSATVPRQATGVDKARVRAYQHLVFDRSRPGCGRDVTPGLVSLACVRVMCFRSDSMIALKVTCTAVRRS